MSFPTTAILDACNRTETPLSNGGTWSSWLSSQLRDIGTSATAASTSGSFATAYWNVQQFTDCEVYATVVGAASTIYLFARANSAATNYYEVWWAAGTSNAEIHSDAGYLANATPGVTISPGDVVGFSVVGHVITSYYNGTQTGQVVDSTYSSGYLAMAVTTGATNGDGFNNFGGGAPVLSQASSYHPSRMPLGV